jgi:hypothetical protein
MSFITSRLVYNATPVAISEDSGTPTTTPAFEKPHEISSFMASAGAATGSPTVTVALKVGPTSAGPWSSPLDKAGVPLQGLSFLRTGTAISGPVASESLSMYPYGRLELVNTTGGESTWTLSSLYITRNKA